MTWDWLRNLPTTNLRILVTLLLAAGTGGRVVFTGWAPPDAWLYFLTAWATVDVGQFLAKRATFKNGAPNE